MIQEVQKIERSIRERRDTDVPLVNYWLYIFLLSWVTLGIYPIVLFFKRIGRIDKFIIRKKEYYEGVIGYTEKYAKENNKYDDLHHQIQDLKNLYEDNFGKKIKELKAGLSFFLSIVTFGIWAIVVLFKQNEIWNKLQGFEQDFDDNLSQIWSKLGLAKYPINFRPDSSKNRSFILYIVLSIVTFGIWGIVWDYKIHTDPDKLYKEFHSVEDTVLNTIRK
ncbi:MAG: DUF4234 domain-containing protein [Deltaproteobacteria bacterium]|nr:DUF4234 domain-containing protein [Deltaproteobacteria bacterium]